MVHISVLVYGEVRGITFAALFHQVGLTACGMPEHLDIRCMDGHVIVLPIDRTSIQSYCAENARALLSLKLNVPASLCLLFNADQELDNATDMNPWRNLY